MNASGVLIGQVLMVLVIIAGGMWYATQWTAAELGYQMRLGAPWVVVHGFPLYHPWRLFQWWYAFEAYAPGLFLRADARFALSGVPAPNNKAAVSAARIPG